MKEWFNLKASKKIAKQERRYLGGYTEFGYKVEDKKLVPDDKEFTVLQSMVNLRKCGLVTEKYQMRLKINSTKEFIILKFIRY